MYYALFEDIQNVVEVNVTASFQGYYKKMKLFCKTKGIGRGYTQIGADVKGKEIKARRLKN